MIRAVIVDDEALAREGIRVRLAREADVQIVGEAVDGPAAVQQITTLQPDLVFLDVQMPGFDGFQVLEQVSAVHLPAIVFVTAYDEYAIRAFEARAVDYLLKPFNSERLQGALQRVRQTLSRQEDLEKAQQRLVALLETLRRSPEEVGGAHLRRLAVRDRDRFVLLKVEEIDWIDSALNYVELHVRQRTHLVRITMNELEQRLDPMRFVRIHRSTIVNIDRVREIDVGAHGDLVVVLCDGTALRLSRGYRDRLLRVPAAP